MYFSLHILTKSAAYSCWYAHTSDGHSSNLPSLQTWSAGDDHAETRVTQRLEITAHKYERRLRHNGWMKNPQSDIHCLEVSVQTHRSESALANELSD
ncbi:hypothetical protein BaRGS_00033927 [Batillaria attramentaria]|uniref:Uncharacterized protein n=1 Tax=Batillaria attramentaria TaxID=370345 RepID=A0ABD0JJE4_9CAEN